MATWKSPIFSDIRNKLGENVVFSMWKGRPYMRSYVKPSNPQTLAQTANRLDMTRLVTHWQTWIAGNVNNVTPWNAAALSDLISGYNRFIKGARGYVLHSTYTLTAATWTFTVDSTSLPINEQSIVVIDVSENASIPCNKKGLGAYTVADFTGWTPAAGDFFYVVDTKASGTNDPSVALCNTYGSKLYYVDEENGALVQMILS